MKVIDLDAVAGLLGGLPQQPRVVVSGNHATPSVLLAAVDDALEGYRLFALNAPNGIPVRDGVDPETVFVGPGVRGHPRLSYVPSRLARATALRHDPAAGRRAAAPPRCLGIAGG